MMAFDFYLLGELQIVRHGAQVPPPPYRCHSLLAALLLRPRPQRRDLLIGLLFPDLPERTGRQRLSHLLWLLRRSLPRFLCCPRIGLECCACGLMPTW